MKTELDVQELRDNVKIFVATPMYGGNCHGNYTKSCIELQRVCSKYGITLNFFYLFNESLITRARNYCVDEFLRSDYTHMMFIDSDIGFNPNDVIAMAGLMDDESEYDIMCGPYPKKCIAWEKIKAAVDQGMADENPQTLSKFVGDYVLNPVRKDGQNSISLGEPAEVMEGGTGFMMIRRSAFERYAEAYPEFSYKPDHVRSKNFDGTREITAFFDCVIDPDSKRYLSEDYMFCQWARKAGIKVWLCPWMRLNHTGTYTFGGSLLDLASIGANATADVNQKIKHGNS